MQHRCKNPLPLHSCLHFSPQGPFKLINTSNSSHWDPDARRGDGGEVKTRKTKGKDGRKWFRCAEAGACRVRMGQSRLPFDWVNSSYHCISLVIIWQSCNKQTRTTNVSIFLHWKFSEVRTKNEDHDHSWHKCSAFHYAVPLTLWHNRVPADKHWSHLRYSHLG